MNLSVALIGLPSGFSRPKLDLPDFAHLKISLLLAWVLLAVRCEETQLSLLWIAL